MQCPMCKNKELELYKTDINLDGKGMRVWLTCSDNTCPFHKVIELGINDLIGIGEHKAEEHERTKDTGKN